MKIEDISIDYKSELTNSLKYLFASMKISGLFHARKNILLVGPSSHDKSICDRIQSFFIQNLVKVMNILVLVVSWGMVIKYTVAIFYVYPVTDVLTFRLISLGYGWQSALESTILSKMTWNNGRYHVFLDHWRSFCLTSAHKGHNQEAIYKKLRRLDAFSIIFYVSCLVLNTVVYYCGMYASNSRSREAMLAILDPFPRTDANIVISSVLIFFLTSPFCLSSLVFVVTSMALAFQFQMITEGVFQIVNSKLRSYPKDLEAFRQDHMELCDLIDLVEPDFKHLLTVAYSLNLFITLFAGYNIVKLVNAGDYDYVIILSVWVILNISKIVILSVCAAYIHEKAHAPLPLLFKVQVKNIELEESTELGLFIQKLQGQGIGFTIWNFTLVRRETILTLISVFLTYFFVLVQFNI